MSEAALIEFLERALSGEYDPVSAIVEGEEERGNIVIRPGDAGWLPTTDWRLETVCSLQGNTARLVLIHAKVERQGAFNRLLIATEAAGLKLAVIDPTPELASTLSRRGWSGKQVGRTFETRERVWAPTVPSTPRATPEGK